MTAAKSKVSEWVYPSCLQIIHYEYLLALIKDWSKCRILLEIFLTVYVKHCFMVYFGLFTLLDIFFLISSKEINDLNNFDSLTIENVYCKNIALK